MTALTLDFDQFNESFMMHSTTSPFYPMIASLDVATSMMDEPAGPTLMYETIQDAISFRKAMSSIAHRLRSTNGEEWFWQNLPAGYRHRSDDRGDFSV